MNTAIGRTGRRNPPTFIDGVKVEFLKHTYPKLADDDLIQGIKLWSLRDVMAIKLSAVPNRSSKKVFYDLASMLDRLPLQILIDHRQTKYHPASLMMVIRSLAWFDETNAEPDPISLRNDRWPEVMHKISFAIGYSSSSSF